jgi:hypothetical protein
MAWLHAIAIRMPRGAARSATMFLDTAVQRPPLVRVAAGHVQAAAALAARSSTRDGFFLEELALSIQPVVDGSVIGGIAASVLGVRASGDLFGAERSKRSSPRGLTPQRRLLIAVVDVHEPWIGKSEARAGSKKMRVTRASTIRLFPLRAMEVGAKEESLVRSAIGIRWTSVAFGADS